MSSQQVLLATFVLIICYVYQTARTTFCTDALHLRIDVRTFRPTRTWYSTQFIPLQSMTGFFHGSYSQSPSLLPRQIKWQKLSILHVVRYGPTGKELNDDNDLSTPIRSGDINNNNIGDTDSGSSINNEQQRMALRKLVTNILSVKDPKHIPSILTKNIELILSCITTEDGAVLVESVIENILLEQPDATTATTVLEAIDIIVSFGEDFVQNTSNVQQQNQILLGKIIKIISTSLSTTIDNDDLNKRFVSREEELDLLLQKERDQFTPGFLRHIENECQRISSAPSMTRESTRLLEVLRIIQTRVLEEICSNELGETAQVLGQIIGYETKIERTAILDAGLTVRGNPFAKELFALTTEALNGFQTVIGGADPDLVVRVQQIHDHLQEFLAKNNSINDEANIFE
jgi:hypothetical protein